MARVTSGLVRWTTLLVVAVAGLALVVRPARAPAAVIPGLALAVIPLVRAWREARGTALRAAVVWGLLAVALGVLAERLAWSEPLSSGRPAAGHVAYLSTLAALAGLISVLNARTPGGSAWAILMGLLVLVFLIPWLEGPGLGGNWGGLGRLRLESPWSLFYGLVVLAGVTNYLPTRYGLAAAWLVLGFALEYVGLAQPGRSPSSRGAIWAAVPWTLAAAVVTADLRARSFPHASSRLEATWFWFRDHWGVVWGLRVMERFNRSAEVSGWPVRLAWHGVVPCSPASDDRRSTRPEVPDAAEATLKGLLRRFASPERVDTAVAGREAVR